MEVLEPNLLIAEEIAINWDAWLAYDNCPRIVTRGEDFTCNAQTVLRKLYAEAAARSLEIQVRRLEGQRLLFQVYDPEGHIPKLPDLPDQRRKYPWDKWFDGEWHLLLQGQDFTMSVDSMRAYIYKVATDRNVKVATTASGNTINLKKMEP